MSKRVSLADIPPQPSQSSSGPPSMTRPQRLPLWEKSWEDLEILCVRLVKKDPDTEHAQSYGVSGQSQEGIDLYVRKKSNGRYVVWQCKRYQAFSKSDLQKAVRTFLKAFRTGEAGIPVKEAEKLILAVTADLSDKKIAKEIERQSKRLRRSNLSFVALDIQGLSDELKKYPDIVADFFHPAWVEEFCGIKSASKLSSELGDAALQMGLRAAQEGLSSYGNADLDRIRDLWGEGQTDEALGQLMAFQKTATWPLLTSEVRAKAVRMEAGLHLAQGNETRARHLLQESKHISPSANSRPLEAKLLYCSQGAEVALAFLKVPQTNDERTLRWHLLLELGRPEEVTGEFALLDQETVPAGDFASALCLAQLAQQDVTGADRTVQAALKEKPRHLALRYAAAVVDYYWGISPAFRGWRHMSWPLPPPWSMVKRDHANMVRRRHASQMFAELARGVQGQQAREFRVWQLACLVLSLEDPTKLSRLVSEWLAAMPTDIPVLVWSSTFRLEFDRLNSITAFKQRLGTGGALEDLLGLLDLLESESDAEECGRLLDGHRQLFVNANRELPWYLHRAEVLIRQGKNADASDLIAIMPEGKERDQIRLIVLDLLAQQTGDLEDLQRLARAQEEEFRRSKSPESLLSCCRTHRRLGRWEFIAEHAEQLISGVGTQSALELAAEGLLHARQTQECLDLLERNRILCQGGDWPPFLRQLAAECHRLLANLPAAIAELEQAIVIGGGVPALMQLFQTQLLKGDLPASLQTARILSKNPSVPAEFLAGQVIPAVRHHDVELARELVRTLVMSAQKLSPGVEAKLVDEGFRLGIEHVTAELFRKLTRASVEGTGPLKALTFEETRQLFADERKAAEDLWAASERGEIPVHFLAARLNLSLALLFHERVGGNLQKRQPALSPALFTRYANDINRHPASLPIETKALFLDITSLLLLDALDLLPHLENTTDHLYIGSSSTQSLERQLDQLSPVQPPRTAARQDATRLIEAGLIHLWRPSTTTLPEDRSLCGQIGAMGIDWCQRLAEVQAEGGLLVDFLPLHSQCDVSETVVLPSPFEKSVASAEQLVTAMGEAGWLSVVDVARALTSLGKGRPAGGGHPVLHEGMPIHLGTTQAEQLALAGALMPLCQRARVKVDHHEAARLRQSVDREIANETLKKEVQRVLARLSRGVEQGKYLVHVARPVEPGERETPLQPEERALFEAIDIAREHKLPVCMDDRMVRQHQSVDGHSQLCDCWDVLHWLRDRNAITPEVFQDTRYKMRLANIRYLPPSAEEIVSCVRHAPIQDDGLVETSELACLRRYTA
ncbi:MAG: hypothetical protein JWR69_1878, partial [Pedosphaera sp.]|nr:hypothetical protein [Pedosphaera sp.]